MCLCLVRSNTCTTSHDCFLIGNKTPLRLQALGAEARVLAAIHSAHATMPMSAKQASQLALLKQSLLNMCTLCASNLLSSGLWIE